MHQIASAMVSATEYGSLVWVPRPRTFGITPAMFAKQYSEHVDNCHCSGRLNGTAVVTVCINLPPQSFGSLDMVV
jgi:hypothetical protein